MVRHRGRERDSAVRVGMVPRHARHEQTSSHQLAVRRRASGGLRHARVRDVRVGAGKEVGE